MSVGLALSGGGSRGIAHIGVIQALLEEEIDIDYLSGTSSGSIVASLFAVGYTPKEIIKIFRCNIRYLNDVDTNIPFKLIKGMFTGKLNVQGLVKGDNLERILRRLYLKKNVRYISDVKIPLYIPVTDLEENKVICFSNKDKMDLATIVRASSSYPGIFIPKYINGKPYVDGGLIANTPANVLKKQGTDKVIAVDFVENDRKKKINNIIDIVSESIDIISDDLKSKTEIEANIMIYLQLENKGVLNFSKFNTYLNTGYNVTKENMDKIKKELEK